MSPPSLGFVSSMGDFRVNVEQPQGRLFDVAPYRRYLAPISDLKTKKLMLKNKELLLKTDGF
jgi:hypothetical protein